MALPYFHSKDQQTNMLQTQWASQINPILNNPILQGNIQSIGLVIGDNVINTKLQRMQQGWIIIDQDASAIIYRSAPLNSTTLTLHSSAAVNISLLVF